MITDTTAIQVQARFHHQYFLGLQLMVSVEKGADTIGDWMFKLFRKQHEDKFVSINGATQIRAGVIRPEIVIPLNNKEIPADKGLENKKLGMHEGSLVRVIRAPFFGHIGIVHSLPSALQKMESETMVRVAEVKIDNKLYIIPRSNLEMLETD